MKRGGILNPRLNLLLSQLGHTDTVAVADCGLPRPPGVEVVDLSLVFGVPTFEQVLRALSTELVVEHALIAGEALDRNPRVGDLVSSLFVRPDTVDHEEFKRRTREARLLVRSGEATPYANVILTCGVSF